MTPDEMSLFEHITELRQRLLRAVIACIVTTTIASFFVENYIIAWLLRPLQNIEGIEIITLGPTEGAVIYFKIALIVGFGMALPYLLYQVYKFIAPGLYPQERVTFLIGIPAVLVLFILGAIFTVEILLPPSMNVLSNIFSEKVQSQYSLQFYLSFFTTLVLWMGLLFQTPLVIYVIARLGGVTPKTLTQGRRAVIFIATIVAAIITPTPDPITMLLVTAPFIVLYEVGILLSHIAVWQRARQEEAEA